MPSPPARDFVPESNSMKGSWRLLMGRQASGNQQVGEAVIADLGEESFSCPDSATPSGCPLGASGGSTGPYSCLPNGKTPPGRGLGRESRSSALGTLGGR